MTSYQERNMTSD